MALVGIVGLFFESLPPLIMAALDGLTTLLLAAAGIVRSFLCFPLFVRTLLMYFGRHWPWRLEFIAAMIRSTKKQTLLFVVAENMMAFHSIPSWLPYQAAAIKRKLPLPFSSLAWLYHVQQL